MVFLSTLPWSLTGHSVYIFFCILGAIFLWIRDSNVYVLRKTWTLLLAFQSLSSLCFIIRDSAFSRSSQPFLTFTWMYFELLGISSSCMLLCACFTFFSHQVDSVRLGIIIIVVLAVLYSIVLIFLVSLDSEVEIYLFLMYNASALVFLLASFSYAYWQEVKILSSRSTIVGVAMIGSFIGFVDFLIYFLGSVHVSIVEATFIWKLCDAVIMLPFVLPAVRTLDQCWCMKDIASQLFTSASNKEKEDDFRKLGIVQADFDDDVGL